MRKSNKKENQVTLDMAAEHLARILIEQAKYRLLDERKEEDRTRGAIHKR